MTDLVVGATTAPDRPQRSAVLRLLVLFANLYLVAFAVDAVISVADDALRVLATEDPTLHAIRNVVGLIVLQLTALVPLLLIFVPHLPKAPFVPSLAFTLLFLLGPLPIEQLSVVQLVAALASFLLLHARTGTWLLSADTLPRKRHLVARTVLAAAATVVVLPLVAAIGAIVGLVVALERETGGYLDVTASGVDVRETVLTKDGRTVQLMAMAHYGEDNFYRTLFEGMPPGSLVLAEGLTDREKRLRAFPSAMRIAKVLGLTQQPGPASLVPPAEKPAPAPEGEQPRAHEAPPVRPDLVVADVDASELSDDTLGLLHDLADLYAGNAPGDALRRVVERTRNDPAVFKRELIDARNAHLLATFDERAGGYDTIAIPWGALHMPGLEAGLLERGYRIESQRMRSVVRFGAIADSLLGRDA